MDIRHNQSSGSGAFEAFVDGKKTGFMTYTLSGDKMSINHTEVDREYGGQGIGKALVDGAVEYARKEQLKINPVCRFADRTLRSSDRYKDVL